MSRPTQRLRARLLVAMVGIALGVLLISALGAMALARNAASDSAISELQQQAPTVATQLTTLRRGLVVARAGGAVGLRLCTILAGLLRATGGSVVTVDSSGTVDENFGAALPCGADRSEIIELPRGLTADDLEGRTLLDGETQTGVVDGTAFVAEPLTTVNDVAPVLVLTQDVETRPLGRAGPYLIGTGAVALLIAAVASALLARRLTRPINAMQATADRIAAGDFSARVGAVPGPDDELAALARSIDTMADELETARGHERAFLLSISHDLRTPLTSIQGYAEAMADGVIESTPDRVRAAGVIATEARRLERLVADLLDLARLDAHEFSLHPRRLDARAIVSATVQGFAPAADEWGVRLVLADGTRVDAGTDPERLAQIVANLVENALKYANTSVVVDVARDDGRLRVRVDDDGPGIPVADRERVFERLYTARDEPGRKVGTGIGLAIVHELADEMGGRARCEPLDSGGTRFVVDLPAGGG